MAKLAKAKCGNGENEENIENQRESAGEKAKWRMAAMAIIENESVVMAGNQRNQYRISMAARKSQHGERKRNNRKISGGEKMAKIIGSMAGVSKRRQRHQPGIAIMANGSENRKQHGARAWRNALA